MDSYPTLERIFQESFYIGFCFTQEAPRTSRQTLTALRHWLVLTSRVYALGGGTGGPGRHILMKPSIAIKEMAIQIGI